MSAIDSPRSKILLGTLWIVFAAINVSFTFLWAGAETIPYHLTWVSFALLYGLVSYGPVVTWCAFWSITVITGIALILHAAQGILEWTECSEIVLMGAILSLLIWHVDRQRAIQSRVVAIQAEERRQAHNRDIAARFGTHEMRTRLTIARGFVELIQRASDEDGIKSDAGLVIGELDKASALADNLLTLVRLHQTGNRTPMEVDSLLESVVHRWRSTADRVWSVNSTVGVVLGDAERLEVLLDCLLENAVKFTRVSDKIAINAVRDGKLMVMTILDTGLGMPPTDLDRVFEIFQTGSSAGARAGSGLGLSIVRAIVDSRGGTVSAESADGVGTCFTIILPIDNSRIVTPPSGLNQVTNPSSLRLSKRAAVS